MGRSHPIWVLGLALWLTASGAHAAEPAMDAGLVSAEALYRTEGAETALPEFERLLGEYQSAGDRSSAAIAQGLIGECHWRLGNFDESRASLDAALAEKRALGDRLQEAKTLNVLGLLEWDLGNFDAAMANFEAASGIGNELGDRKIEGATLNNLSLILDELGDFERSLAQYQDVLRIYSDIDFPRGEGDTLGNIGGVHLLLGQYTQAIDFYTRALEISERLASIPSMSQDNGNLGMAYAGLGQTERALEHLDRALELAESAGMRQEEGFWLRGRGNVMISAGRYDQGLENHRQALTIYRDDGANALLLDALHDMGQLLLTLGDPASAEEYFAEAMDLAQTLASPRAVSLNLIALGDLQLRHDHPEAAAKFFSDALEQARETGLLQLESRSLGRLASAHREQAMYDQAEVEGLQALELARNIGARPLESAAFLELADTDREAGRAGQSLARYGAAETIANEIGDPDLQWRVQFGRGLAQIDLGQPRAAVESLTRAVEHIESIRSRIREDRFRAGYLQDKQQVYVLLVRLQLELGETGEAFSTSERMRSWSFAEQGGDGDRSSWTEAQKDSETAMKERIRQLQRMLDEEQSLPVPQQRQRAVASFSQQLMVAESEYQNFLDDRNAAGRVRHDSTAGASAEDAREQLGDREALIEYVVGLDQVMVFVLTRNSIRAKAVPQNLADLHARLELLRDLLQEQDDDRWYLPAVRLAEALIAPVRSEGWLEGIDHLYLVPHGILNYLPFALLPLGIEPGSPLLITDYSLSYLPTALAMESTPENRTGDRNFLALAPARSHLRFAPQEAATLGDLYQAQATVLTGNSATETAFRDQAGKYQLLHLATHGYFNKLNPMLSGLELEADELHDGLLEVHEILELSLASELVTLSACETGMGSGFFAEIPAGDDFVGLTRAFLQAGSNSVLATLWQVNDRSTVDLMTGFYSRLEDPGNQRDKAVALAEAQRKMRASKEFRHPYFWAPFVLVGPLHESEGARG